MTLNGLKISGIETRVKHLGKYFADPMNELGERAGGGKE